MNEVFGDASFFVALISERDLHHRLADELEQRYRGRIVTTQWVVLEVANFFAGSKQRSIATEFLAALLGDPGVAIEIATPGSFLSGWELYQRRTDKSWSLTDCISFNTMNNLGLKQALTNDHHFEQAGFEILMK